MGSVGAPYTMLRPIFRSGPSFSARGRGVFRNQIREGRLIRSVLARWSVSDLHGRHNGSICNWCALRRCQLARCNAVDVRRVRHSSVANQVARGVVTAR
jgi:hypothetical protein